MLVVVISVAEQIQSVDAAGIVIVQVPEFVVTKFTLKADVPLFETIEAPVVPHPLVATEGAVVEKMSAF